MGLKAKEKYEQRKVDRLYDHLKLYHDKGRPIDFEIIVDDFKAIRRTNELDMFNAFESYVNAKTNIIEILLYAGSSNSYDKYTFIYGNSEESLDGINLQEKIDAGVAKKMKEQDFEKLTTENKELKAEIEDLEKEVTRLERKNEQLQADKSPLSGALGQFGASFFESLVKNNPKIIKSIPGGETLAGLLDNGPTVTEEPVEDVEVSFTPKNNNNNTNNNAALSDADRNAIEFVNQIRTQFSTTEYDKIAQIVDTIVDRQKFEQVLTLLNIKF